MERLAVELVRLAQESGLLLRLVGGVAVRIRCRVIRQQVPELDRQIRDIDLAGLSQQRAEVEDFLADNGFVPHRELNTLGSGKRLLFFGTGGANSSLRVDVFLDRLVMCHVLKLGHRLNLHKVTISATDLLLSKLQVVFPSEEDAKDVLALLGTFDFGAVSQNDDYFDKEYICCLCSRDWGWHRTVALNLERVNEWAQLIDDAIVREAVRTRANVLIEALRACPKSWKWHLRDLLGERVRWYQIPEQVALD